MLRNLLHKKIIKAVRHLLVLSMPIVIVACASAPPELIIEADDWVFEARAINVTLKAPADLNSVSGRPHSLAIGVFQLNDPNTFTGLSVTKEGAVELMQKGKIDDTVSNFTLINVRPGEQRKVSINRAQTAQYIGIISGYYEMNPKNDVKIFPIPLKELERGLVEKAMVTLQLMTDEVKAAPDKLNLYIDLGRTSTKRIVTLDQVTEQTSAKSGGSNDSPKINWFEKINETRNDK